FGTPLQDFRDWRRIGYVPQRSGILVQQATAREVVASGRLARRRPFTPANAADRRAIAAALERVGLADRANHPFVRLSGGQQQRVLIARALATGAELMMWDEPLAGVDHATQALLADVAAALKADRVTIVMVLHELGCFEPVIDRAISLSDGRVIGDGPLTSSHSDGHEIAELKPTKLHHTGLEAV
ncbi:MAG: ATP-binding cassette domain-containing protein, partial [Propionicimonas sp.]